MLTNSDFGKKNGYLYLLFIKFINLLFFCNLFKLIFIEDGDGDWKRIIINMFSALSRSKNKLLKGKLNINKIIKHFI